MSKNRNKAAVPGLEDNVNEAAKRVVTDERQADSNDVDQLDIPLTTLYSAESENPEDEDIGAYFVTKAADVVAHEVLERQEEAEAKKCTLIASFGEYIENRWYPTLIIISRLSWKANFWEWIRNNFPDVVKYWPKGGQMLQQVMIEDASITKFPTKVVKAVGSLEEFTNNSSIIFSAFAGRDNKLTGYNTRLGRKLIEELPSRFPNLIGPDNKPGYDVKKISGFNSDQELIKFAAAIKVAKPVAVEKPMTSPYSSPAKRIKL